MKKDKNKNDILSIFEKQFSPSIVVKAHQKAFDALDQLIAAEESFKEIQNILDTSDLGEVGKAFAEREDVVLIKGQIKQYLISLAAAKVHLSIFSR